MGRPGSVLYTLGSGLPSQTASIDFVALDWMSESGVVGLSNHAHVLPPVHFEMQACGHVTANLSCYLTGFAQDNSHGLAVRALGPLANQRLADEEGSYPDTHPKQSTQ